METGCDFAEAIDKVASRWLGRWN